MCGDGGIIAALHDEHALLQVPRELQRIGRVNVAHIATAFLRHRGKGTDTHTWPLREFGRDLLASPNKRNGSIESFASLVELIGRQAESNLLAHDPKNSNRRT